MMKKHTPDPIDIHVGKQIRSQRKKMGLSQEQLAQVFGVSFQQVQKYERGTNRVCASKLYILTKTLKVPVAYFYEGMPEVAEEALSSESSDPQEIQELTENYYRIKNRQLRQRIVSLSRALGDGA